MKLNKEDQIATNIDPELFNKYHERIDSLEKSVKSALKGPHHVAKKAIFAYLINNTDENRTQTIKEIGTGLYNVLVKEQKDISLNVELETLLGIKLHDDDIKDYIEQVPSLKENELILNSTVSHLHKNLNMLIGYESVPNNKRYYFKTNNRFAIKFEREFKELGTEYTDIRKIVLSFLK